VHQEEFFHLRMIKRLAGADRSLSVTCRFRGCVGVECRSLDVPAARPESRADHFMRIGFPGDGICPFTRRSATPGEACDGQVKTSPEEMHRTIFPDEAATEFFENSVDQHQDAPEPGDIFTIVGSVLDILFKGNRVRNFAGHSPDLHLNAQRFQRSHDLFIEISHRTGNKRNDLTRASAGPDYQIVIKKIELYLEDATLIGNGRSGEAAVADVERNVP